MILDISKVRKNIDDSISFDYDLNLNDYEFYKNFYPFKEKIKVYGDVKNKAGVVYLNLNVNTNFHTYCDRCGEELVEKLSYSIEYAVVNHLEYEDNDELLLAPEDTLDMDELAFSLIVLNLPQKHLCKDDCKGLCQFCGKNLNIENCNCK